MCNTTAELDQVLLHNTYIQVGTFVATWPPYDYAVYTEQMALQAPPLPKSKVSGVLHQESMDSWLHLNTPRGVVKP